MTDASLDRSDQSGASASSAHGVAARAVMVRGVKIATGINTVSRAAVARTPAVFLPAADVSWTAYRPILDALAAERRVAALDWPGFGASSRPTPTEFHYSAQTYAELLEPWLAALGIGRLVLVGNSVGGAAAIHFALAHPERVLGLVLVAPVGFAPGGTIRRLVCRLLGTHVILARVEPLLLSLALGPATPATRAILAANRSERREHPADFAARIAAYAALWLADAAPTADLADVARGVRAPSVVIRGALDPIVSDTDTLRAAESLGARGGLRVVLPEAGHLPFLQQAGPFLRAVRSLLETADSANAPM